jgi:hypothetical protein
MHLCGTLLHPGASLGPTRWNASERDRASISPFVSVRIHGRHLGRGSSKVDSAEDRRKDCARGHGRSALCALACERSAHPAPELLQVCATGMRLE